MFKPQLILRDLPEFEFRAGPLKFKIKAPDIELAFLEIERRLGPASRLGHWIQITSHLVVWHHDDA